MNNIEYKYTHKIWEKINKSNKIKLDFSTINTIEELLVDYHQNKVKENELLYIVTKRNWFEQLPLHWKLSLHTSVGILLGFVIGNS